MEPVHTRATASLRESRDRAGEGQCLRGRHQAWFQLPSAVPGTGYLGTETRSESRAQRPHAHLGASVQGILTSGTCHQKEEEPALMHVPAHKVHDLRHRVRGEGA